MSKARVKAPISGTLDKHFLEAGEVTSPGKPLAIIYDLRRLRAAVKVPDTYIPLILPSYFGWAYGTFLARQYYTTIPFELEDAARVDGCGAFAIYFKIMMPLSIPLLVTLGLFSFVGDWNDFFNPLIYLTSPDKYTLQLGLLSFRGQYITNIPAMMAASVLIILPVLLIFLFGQQYFIRSVVLSGLKG